MSEKFDPYQRWLGIPPEEQPPNHYRLLGIRPFEEAPDVIQSAADQRIGYLHAFQTGEHAALSVKLLDEVAAAKDCLLNPNRKAGYDTGLRQSLEAETAKTNGAEETQRARSRQFLAVLQEKDLLPARLIEGLRKQIAQSKKPIPAATVAKRLIEEGYLTPALAKRLLAAVSEGASPPTEAPAKPPPKKGKEKDGLGLAPLEEEQDELGLAPLEEDKPAAKPGVGRHPQPAATKAPPQPTAKAPIQEPPQKEPPPGHPVSAAASGSLLEEELPPLGEGPGGAVGVGPLDGLLADSSLDAAVAAEGSPLAPVVPKKKGLRKLFAREGKKKKGDQKTNVWDSSLLLVGGGTLLALLILGSVLVWALTRKSGDEALKLADEDYALGSYTQAISKYEQYLERFPGHSGVSTARVNHGLARLRQATPQGTTDWSAALELAGVVVPEIAEEEEYATAQGELWAMLPGIAEGLAEQARQNADPELVAQARKALDLIRTYVSRQSWEETRLKEIDESVRQTERIIACSDELDKAIADIEKATEQRNAQQAYLRRKDFLKQYSSLENMEPKLWRKLENRLEQAVLEASQAQHAAVKWVAEVQPGDTTEPDTTVLSALALARRTTAADVPGVAGHVVFANAGGAVYGLDATTGKVLWRRFVGFDANSRRPRFPPTPISEAPGSDVLLVTSLRNEVQKEVQGVQGVEAATGRVLWRQAIPEGFDAHPVIAGDRILVATRSGRLVTIENEVQEVAAGGSSPGYIQLPQPLRVAPAVNSRRSLIFQVADQYDLFVLGFADHQCKQVIHLGHEPGSIIAPPVLVGRLLIVAENDHAKSCTLRVLSVEEGEKEVSVTHVQRLELEDLGQVDTAPLVAGRKVAVVTDLGAVRIFEISGTGPNERLTVFHRRDPRGEEKLTRFCLIKDEQFWIADTRLTKYEIREATRELVPKWRSDEGSAFQQSPVPIGQTIFHVRRKDGMPGVLVAATAMVAPEETGRPQRYWETHLAAPLAGEPIVDAAGGKITAVTSIGGVYQGKRGQDSFFSVDGLTSEHPSQRKNSPDPFFVLVRLDGGLLVITAGEGSDRIAVFDPRRRQNRFTELKLRERDTLACPPIAFAGGLLAPGKKGQVYHLDPRTGKELSKPFQPRLESGVEIPWRLPAVAGENEKEVVLADGDTKLYRLGIKDQPDPHLAALDETKELTERIVSPVAVVGEVAYAVDEANVLAAFKLPELSRTQVRSLTGRCVWGPRRVGNRVMLSTDDGQLLCLDAGGNLLWQRPLPYGPLAGTPLTSGQGYVLAATGGVVWRVDAESGEELGKIETGRPLGTGPVLLDTQLLLGGHDGTLYRIERP